MEHIEWLVIGARVVGLAVAEALARAGLQTVVLEAAPSLVPASVRTTPK